VIPQLRVWHERYQRDGLTIVGVHTPDIRYPVVLDNDWASWRRFAVRAWPTAVLVDRRGVVRHVHIGEGAYAETESLMRRLLAEPPPG
jgi:hypothetical protein